MSSQILFFFSALGAFNGLILALYLFFSKPVSIQHRLLSALILVISLRVSKSIWFYFDPNIGKQFLQLGLSACFLIGPLLYFYVVSQVCQLEKLTFHWKAHLSLLLSLIIGAGILFPYQSNAELWGIFYQIINISWGIYIVASAIKLFPKLVVWVGDNSQISKQQLLCVNVLIGTGLIWLAYYTASYTSYIAGALSFSFILYVSISIWLIANKNSKESLPYANKKIKLDVASQLESRLNELMANEQLFKNANLTLPILAKKLHVSVPQLSQ